VDRDIEFTPALFGNLERGFVEGFYGLVLVLQHVSSWNRERGTLLRLRKSRMQLVHDLLENIGWNLLSLVVYEP
jgi:hypothetical protein